jgi:hypothetical protein
MTNPELTPRGPLYRYQYAVKFICTSHIPGTSQTSGAVLPGHYQTAVNVHNPNRRAVAWRRKLALGPDLIRPFINNRLRPDGLFRVDCDDVTRDFGPFIHGVEGFLVIESTASLDVTAVYTAAGQDGWVSSLDIEQIKERDLRAA